MSLSNNQRNQSLDFLKAISIFLVVFFHNAQLNPDGFIDNLLMLIANAAVPCFFLASGAVFFLRPFDLHRHIRRIIKFYLAVCAWKAVYLVLYLYWGAPFDGSLRTIFSYLFLFQTWDGVGTAHFWFMDAMLTVLLAAPLLYLCFHSREPESRLKGHSQYLVFLLAVLILFNQLPNTGGVVMTQLGRLLSKPALDLAPLAEVSPFSFRYSNYFTYYLLGGLLAEQKERVSAKTAAILALGGTGGLLLIKYLQAGTFLWQDTHLLGGYYYLSTMALSCGLFLLAGRLNCSRSRPLAWISSRAGVNTLGIFYLHIPLIHVLTPALFEKLHPLNSWIVNSLESLLICAISLAVIWVGGKVPVIRNLFH